MRCCLGSSLISAYVFVGDYKNGRPENPELKLWDEWAKFKYKPLLKSMARMFRVHEGGKGGKMPLAHALTRGMGWGSCEPPEPADEGTG
ncbi:MAG: hypothetical protein DSO07_08655, partial [Thermoproteota archaeon]